MPLELEQLKQGVEEGISRVHEESWAKGQEGDGKHSCLNES